MEHRARSSTKLPVVGLCAGMEVLAENIIGEDAVRHLLYGKFLRTVQTRNEILSVRVAEKELGWSVKYWRPWRG